jgi:dTDP-4-amino-4,6-dideoxygalactose transaminase
VDVLEGNWTIDPRAVQDYFDAGKKAVAIIPVHLYGKMAAMDELVQIARTNGAYVIEDAAQAHGASLRGKGPGQWGDVACFSFYPGKNLGAFGDAGAIVSNNSELLQKAKAFVNHGRGPNKKYLHSSIGGNFRIDTIQAAILRIKLEILDDQTKQRQNLAKKYSQKLEGLPIQLPIDSENSEAVFHLYVVHLDARDKVKSALSEAGISAGIHYPVPLHLQKAYQGLGHKAGDFPVSERNAQQALSLPLWPEMTEEEQDYVVATLKSIVKKEN